MRHHLLLLARRSVAVLAAGLVLGVVAVSPAAAVDPVFSISADQISKPVGIATDTATSSYWVVNDTGAQVFALSRTGQVKGTVDFRAEPVDVQAAAYRSGRLYVGDIGDADRNREFVSVFSFPNLTPGSGTVTYQSWDLAYPDGAHDAKAMVVDPAGRLYLITSGDKPGIYAAPQQPSRAGVNQLERVADAPAGVTDAVALSADRWALRTATVVQEIDASSFKKVAERTLPVPDGDTLGIDLAAASGSSVGLVAGSAGASADVYAVVAPSVAPTESASQSPSSTSTPKPSGSGAATTGEDDPAEDAASDSSRSGTVMAIGIAALIAVLAGLAAYLWPGRAQQPARPARSAHPRSPASQPRGATFAPSPPSASSASSASVPPGSPMSPVRQQTPVYPGASRAAADPNRARPPGDIEDDDPFDDTTIRADQLPGRRAEATSPPVATGEPPRRSLGYDPELWGEDTLRRRPGLLPPDDGSAR